MLVGLDDGQGMVKLCVTVQGNRAEPGSEDLKCVERRSLNTLVKLLLGF